MHAPSGNGTNGTGRDARGRFVRGNAGGPGNPFARRVAAARKALLDAAGPEQIAQIVRALVERAIAGDVAAARVVLRYTVGDVTGTLDALLRMRAAMTWFSSPLKPADAAALIGVAVDPPPYGPASPTPAEALRAVAAALGPATGGGNDQRSPLAAVARRC